MNIPAIGPNVGSGDEFAVAGGDANVSPGVLMALKDLLSSTLV
jgi:hypothetical protein